jgi:hypothetical protein
VNCLSAEECVDAPPRAARAMVRIWPPQGAGLCGQSARLYISAALGGPWPVFYFGLRVKGAGMGVRRSRESESGVLICCNNKIYVYYKKGRDKKRYQSFRGLAYLLRAAGGRPLGRRRCCDT